MPATGSTAPADRLRRAVGYAITGAEVPAPAGTDSQPIDQPIDRPFDAERLITELGGADRLRAAAAEARAAGRAWPHPVPDRLRAGLGAAQLHAAVQQVRSAIDQAGPAAVRRPGGPDADDLRLLRDVPPHHGR